MPRVARARGFFAPPGADQSQDRSSSADAFQSEEAELAAALEASAREAQELERRQRHAALPEGWEMKIDPSTGSAFFVNHRTKVSCVCVLMQCMQGRKAVGGKAVGGKAMGEKAVGILRGK